MGTSKGYDAPTGPLWGAVKRAVTAAAPGGRPTPDVAREIVAGYVTAAGGPRGIASGTGSAGRGRAAQRVAAGLAAFVGAVAREGLPAALDRIGLASLVGRPTAEVLDAIIDQLGGPANTLDDVDARNALSALRDEIFDREASLKELEASLATVVSDDALGDLLIRFFAQYLYEQFTRVFYERLVARVGDGNAAAFLTGIRDYIVSTVHEHHSTHDLRTVDWASQEGQRIADDILEETFRVFTGA